MPDLFGFSDDAIARAAGVDLRTARRWKDTGRMPSPARALLTLTLHGDLTPLDGAWTGWKLHRGDLWSPEGHAFAPGDLRALPYLRELHVEVMRNGMPGRQLQLLPRDSGAPVRGLAKLDGPSRWPDRTGHLPMRQSRQR